MLRIAALDLLLPVVLGGAATLGFAPFNAYGLTLLAIIGLVALWWNVSVRRGAWRGFAFGCAHFGSGVYWTFVATYEYGGAPMALAIVLTCGLAIYMALYPAAVGAFAGAARRAPRPLWALLLVPGAWLFGELVRGAGVTGFPWLSLGYVLINTPVAILAPIGGVHFLSFLMLAAAGTVVLVFAGSLAGRAIAVLVIAAIPFVLWQVPGAGHWTHATRSALSVDLIQGNVPMSVKSRPGTLTNTMVRYQRLTRASKADLVVWPETAIPVPAARVSGYLNTINRLAANRQQTVLAGILARHQGTYYNAVLALGEAHGHYYKRHLVPFGEYLPVPAFVKHWLDSLHMEFTSLGFGPQHQPLITVDGTKIGVSICFEDAFGYEIAKALPAAGILVNVTNDAWFAGTIAPAQHLQIARMRALEAGRTMAIAANTGISAIIDYHGRVRRQTAQFTVATLSGRLAPRTGLTPYMRFGDGPLWGASAALIVLGLLWRLRARQRTGALHVLSRE